MGIKTYVFDGGVLTGAAVIQGSVVGALTTRIIRAATIVNTTAAAVSVTVALVPAAGALSAANTLISGKSIAPGDSYSCPELVNQGINAGGALQALGLGLTFKYTATDII